MRIEIVLAGAVLAMSVGAAAAQDKAPPFPKVVYALPPTPFVIPPTGYVLDPSDAAKPLYPVADPYAAGFGYPVAANSYPARSGYPVAASPYAARSGLSGRREPLCGRVRYPLATGSHAAGFGGAPYARPTYSEGGYAYADSYPYTDDPYGRAASGGGSGSAAAGYDPPGPGYYQGCS
jgi:hypothetical protein